MRKSRSKRKRGSKELRGEKEGEKEGQGEGRGEGNISDGNMISVLHKSVKIVKICKNLIT